MFPACACALLALVPNLLAANPWFTAAAVVALCVQSKAKTLHFNSNVDSRVLSHWRLNSVVLVVVALRRGRVWRIVHRGHVVSKTGLESDILLPSSSFVNPASSCRNLLNSGHGRVNVLRKASVSGSVDVSK